MPVAAYYLHDPAAPRPNSPTRMGTNVLLECRGRLLLEQRWDCGAWGLPGGRLRRGESEAHGIARELFEETGLRLPEAAFTRVRVVDDADRIASYQDGTVWRMVIVLFRAQLPQEPELHCSRESCTLRFFTPEELRTADLVSLHCPLTKDNAELIDRQTIAKMKDGALLVNNARGQLLNEQDVADALNSGKLAGAALDVVSAEPIHADNPLLSAKNCILTPHISWAPLESRQRIMDITAANIQAFLNGAPQNVVNK